MFGINLDKVDISNDYSTLNLLIKGISKPVPNNNKNITYFDFYSNEEPCIFIYPINDNEVTAQHLIQKLANRYIAYFVGNVEVYVFTKGVNRNEKYGISLYNEAGKIFYTTGDSIIKPVSLTYLPAVKPNNSVKISTNGIKCAYALMANRMSFILYTGKFRPVTGGEITQLAVHRDVIIRNGNNFFEFHHAPFPAGDINPNLDEALSNNAPNGIMLIDVSTL